MQRFFNVCINRKYHLKVNVLLEAPYVCSNSDEIVIPELSEN